MVTRTKTLLDKKAMLSNLLPSKSPFFSVLPGKTFPVFLSSPQHYASIQDWGLPRNKLARTPLQPCDKNSDRQGFGTGATKTLNSWTVTSSLCVNGRGSNSSDMEPTVTVKRPGAVPTNNSCYIVDLTRDDTIRIMCYKATQCLWLTFQWTP